MGGIICGAVFLLFVAAVHVHDRMRTRHAPLRNYPVVGHFRCMAEAWGLDLADKAFRVSAYVQQAREQVEVIAHSCDLRHSTGFTAAHVTEVERRVFGFWNRDWAPTCGGRAVPAHRGRDWRSGP